MGRIWTSVIIVGAATACAVAAVLVSRRLRERSKQRRIKKIVRDFQDACRTSNDRLQAIADAMNMEMAAGLRTSGGSRLKMLPSYVDRLPDGNEQGLFYALDLGGTNFRVLRTMLGGGEKRIVRQEYVEVAIPKELMTGTTEGLFGFIAEKLAEFVAKESDDFKPLKGQRRELGFTFSFPCEQTAINGGLLLRWTKGFQISETVGKDVVPILEEAIRKQGVEMHVNALVNDTVGTLAGAHYWNGDAMVAVILGTGSNACYVEKMDAIGKWDDQPSTSGSMVVNMEWGNFWSSHLPVTFADMELDKQSLNPGEQGFEKMIGGMYLGEVVRIVLKSLASEAGLFGPGPLPPKLLEQGALPTPKMSRMDEDVTPDLSVLGELLSDLLEISNTTLAQRAVVKEIIGTVAERGARLAGAGIVGVLKKIGRDRAGLGKSRMRTYEQLAALKTYVAVDGGLYEHYARFRHHMHLAIDELLGDEATGLITIDLSKDGSGIGAALLAATHSKYNVKQRGDS